MNFYINRIKIKENYNELLLDYRWKIRKSFIKCRDNYTCQICKTQYKVYGKFEWDIWKDEMNDFYYQYITISHPHLIFQSNDYLEEEEIINYFNLNRKSGTLEVHHKKYIQGEVPWSNKYSDDDLITLCHNCHTKIHQKK